MTKPQEILTPSLPQFVAEIIEFTKQGYRIHRDPEMLGWQYYCEMVQGGDNEKVVMAGDAPVEAPKRGPKAKTNKEPAKA